MKKRYNSNYILINLFVIQEVSCKGVFTPELFGAFYPNPGVFPLWLDLFGVMGMFFQTLVRNKQTISGALQNRGLNSSSKRPPVRCALVVNGTRPNYGMQTKKTTHCWLKADMCRKLDIISQFSVTLDFKVVYFYVIFSCTISSVKAKHNSLLIPYSMQASGPQIHLVVCCHNQVHFKEAHCQI